MTRRIPGMITRVFRTRVTKTYTDGTLGGQTFTHFEGPYGTDRAARTQGTTARRHTWGGRVTTQVEFADVTWLPFENEKTSEDE
jgi:hypothetical protein